MQQYLGRREVAELLEMSVKTVDAYAKKALQDDWKDGELKFPIPNVFIGKSTKGWLPLPIEKYRKQRDKRGQNASNRRSAKSDSRNSGRSKSRKTK